MTDLSIVEQIEQDQILRFSKRKNDLYSLLDRPTKRQLDRISKRIRLMFNRDTNNLIEVNVFKLVSNSNITLDRFEQLVKRNMSHKNIKNITIDTYLAVLESEIKKIK